MFRDARERPEPLPAWLADRSRTQLGRAPGRPRSCELGKDRIVRRVEMEMLTARSLVGA